jgi:hypothetical protein
MEEFPGRCPVTLMIAAESWQVRLDASSFLVDPSEAMMTAVERVFGEKVCELC